MQPLALKADIRRLQLDLPGVAALVADERGFALLAQHRAAHGAKGSQQHSPNGSLSKRERLLAAGHGLKK